MVSVTDIFRLPRRLRACANSVYQALPPIFRAPWNEAMTTGQPLVSYSDTNLFYIHAQGQFPCPLHTLGEAMLQYWFKISDVLVQSSQSISVHQATTPFLLIILVALACITGMFT